MESLNPAQKLVYLSIHPKKGKLTNISGAINYTLPGMVLAQMAADGKVSLKDGRVRLNQAHSKDRLEKIIIKVVQKWKKPARIKRVLHESTMRSGRMLQQVKADLVREGYLNKRRHRFLGLIPYTRYPVSNQQLQADYNTRLRDILLKRKRPEDKDAVLLAFLALMHFEYPLAKDKQERRKLKKALKEYLKADQVSTEAGKALREMQAAVMAATTSATAAATSSSS